MRISFVAIVALAIALPIYAQAGHSGGAGAKISAPSGSSGGSGNKAKPAPAGVKTKVKDSHDRY